jgi:hypothetical protein
MSITIHIKLLSGDVINCPVRARGGKAKFTTVRDALCAKVFDELKLDSSEWRVKLSHDDDDEKRDALRQQRWDSAIRQYRRPARPMPSQWPTDMSAQIAIQSALDKQRTYQEGDVVHALVEPFNIRRLWDELNEDDYLPEEEDNQ